MVKNILFICVFSMVGLLANEPTGKSVARRLETSSIVQVITQQVDSIESFDDGRLYLKPENIYHTNVGQVLYNGYSTIFLPTLSSDRMGYYLSYRSREDFELKCTNPKCGYQWSILEHASVYCPRCGWMGE